jgi:shikimate kinase
MNIVLIGYRGTGKTSVAQRIALRLGWSWVDADVEVELAAGKSIAAIFADDGEPRFRDLEATVLPRLLGRDRHVLALGGGVVLREANRRLLGDAANVVWLTAKAETVFNRINADPVTAAQRPNLTAAGGLPEIVELLAFREPLYRECADVEVDTENKTIDEVAGEILSRLHFPKPDAQTP